MNNDLRQFGLFTERLDFVHDNVTEIYGVMYNPPTLATQRISAVIEMIRDG